MKKDKRTDLQKVFEKQTPTIIGVSAKEYIQTYCAWLEFQIEKSKYTFTLEWLKEHKRFIKIRAIEQELNMPDSTLIKAVNGVQSLPKKWFALLNDFLYGFVKTNERWQNIKTD